LKDKKLVKYVTIHPGRWSSSKGYNGGHSALENSLIDSLEILGRSVRMNMGAILCLENNFYNPGDFPFCVEPQQLARIVDETNSRFKDGTRVMINFDISHYFTARNIPHLFTARNYSSNSLETLSEDFQEIRDKVGIVGLSDFKMKTDQNDDEAHLISGGDIITEENYDILRDTFKGYREIFNLEMFPRVISSNSLNPEGVYKAISKSKPVVERLIYSHNAEP